MLTYLLVLCVLGDIAVPHSEAGCLKTKPGLYSKGGGRKTPTVAPSADGAQKIAKASNNFSQRLYREIALGSKNTIYSPLSIHTALSMTSLGAKGDTKTEMTSTLGLDVFTGEREPHQAYNDVIAQLNAASNVTTILTANAIFINKLETVESAFVRDVQNFYLSNVSTFDPHDPAGPERVINEYVEYKTRGLIQNLVQPNVVTALTLMVLVNTVYFNGSWDRPFDKDRTQPADFHTQQGTIQVDTMFDTRTMNIKRNFHGADVGELTIGHGRFSVVIVLPHTVDGLADLENALTVPGRVEELFQDLTPVRVNVSMPKVNIESTFMLSQPLIQLGMVKAFSPHEADFTGINRNGNIFIKEGFHQSTIEINEYGTVASAATAVVIEMRRQPPAANATFQVDHPFLFLLTDNRLRSILFQGKFIQP
ncbi:unnamed protein product [Candidula unifasciata]|uniref:Serpin domain-containing protein n=1 Tax=Candidula unifasciata TaxID=100452 RepID=A0A8S3Z4D4_9EUPU|nr:unnamed protein product [Candidula unifasciata]